MAEKKVHDDTAKRIAELERKVAELYKFLRAQYEVKQHGGDLFGNYPQE